MSKQEDLSPFSLCWKLATSIYLMKEQGEGAQRQLGNTQIIALLFPVMFSLFLTKLRESQPI